MGCDASNSGMPEQPFTLAKKQGKLTIYGDDFDSDTRILKAICEEAGCEFNFEDLFFLNPTTHTQKLEGKSPGIFPILTKDHLHTLCQNKTLIDTLLAVETKAQDKFRGAEVDAAKVNEEKVMLEFFYSKIRPVTEKLVRRSCMQKREGEDGLRKIQSAKGLKNFELNFYAFEKQLLPKIEEKLDHGKSFIMGDNMSIIDIVMFCEFDQIKQTYSGFEVNHQPHLSGWYDNMLKNERFSKMSTDLAAILKTNEIGMPRAQERDATFYEQNAGIEK